MAILSKGTTYADGDQITSTNLNALVDSATFAAGAVESGGGLQLNGSSPAQLKVAGNVDIGTSNLTATGAISLGATTFNDKNITEVASIAVDTIIADNTDLTIDVIGDITLDAGGADIRLKDDGTQFGRLANSSSNLIVASSVSDKDILFQGSDGGSTITALTLDMSAAGAATFNDKITAVGTSVFTNLDVSGDVDFGGIVTISDTTPIIRTISNDKNLTLRGGNTDAGGQIKLYGSTASSTGNDIHYFANEHEFWNTAVSKKIAFNDDEISFGSAQDVNLYRSAANTLKTDDSFEVAVNLDVDGTTNLDVVDIDGAVDMATTLALAGNADFNGNLDVAGLTLLTNALTVTGNVDFNGSLDVLGITNLDVVDIDGAVDMATTALVTGVLTTTATQVATGGITSGSSILSDTDSTDSLGSTAVRWLKGWFDTLTAGTLTIGAGSVTDSSGAISFGNENLTTTGTVTAAGTSVFTNLDISGDVDVEGTLNVDAIDIDGNVQVDGTVTVGVNDTGHDVKFYGATSGAYMHWDESTDDLILAGASKLGIGTTSPSGELHVNNSGAAADLYLSSGTTSDAIVALQTNTGGTAREARIGYDYSASLLKLVTGSGFSGSTSGINIDTSGNVGIGTTSPQGHLHINTESAEATEVYIDGESNQQKSVELRHYDASEASGAGRNTFYLKTKAADKVTLGGYNDSSSEFELVTFQENGNVGIGTAAPAEKLEVAGNIQLDSSNANLLIKQGTGGTTGGMYFTFSSDATKYAGMELVYDTRTTVGPRFYSQNGYDLTVDSGDDLHLQTDSTDRLTILNAGNVGIGITSPNSKLTIVGDDEETAAINTATATTLEVAGNGGSSNSGGAVVFSAASGAWKFAAIKGLAVSGTANTTGDLAFSTRNATGDSTLTERMRIKYDGYVGINDTSPSYQLDVNGTGRFTSNLRVDGNAQTYGGAYDIYRSGGGYLRHRIADEALYIGVTNTAGVIHYPIVLFTVNDVLQFNNEEGEMARFDTSGNLGLGTTSPDEKLDVVGAGRFSTGVTFGTDTAAVNKLDDYEEGTFTPVLKIGGATTGIGYGAAVGSYTKIGNLVNASLYVLLSSKGSATGSVTIDGLPFASANTTNGFASAHIGSILACTWANYPAGYLSKNTSAITFNQYTEAGGSSAISNSNLTDTSSFIMSITYRV